MAPIIMMKLKLVAVAFGVAQAATKICADDGDFNGTKPFLGLTCAVIQTSLPAFTATAQSCAADMTWAGQQQRASTLMGTLGACCKTGVHVCEQFVALPCADRTKFMPKNMMSGTACTVAVGAMLGAPFVADKATCAVLAYNNNISDKAMTRTAATAVLAPFCCSDKVSACAAFTDTKVTSSLAMGAIIAVGVVICICVILCCIAAICLYKTMSSDSDEESGSEYSESEAFTNEQ